MPSMAEPSPRAFVVGHPIAHSRSPLIHTHWLKTLRLAGTYEKQDIAPADFAGFLAGMRQAGFIGGNVTIPHKETAFSLVARRDAAAEAIGAVNTIWMEDGELCGSNTDAYGFAASLDDDAPQWRESQVAVVLGAGGASRAILHALSEAAIGEIRLVNRTEARARTLAERFGGVTVFPWDDLDHLLAAADLLVNTTSMGMDGNAAVLPDLALLPRHAIVSDIVYVPLLTPLLVEAKRHGLNVSGGLGMLLHQAVPGFERWFGVRPEVTPELRALVEADVEAKR